VLLPALPWEGVWKEFEAELVKLETQECSNKLRVENGADKVKDVRQTLQFISHTHPVPQFSSAHPSPS
jgi:hypothetical protein